MTQNYKMLISYDGTRYCGWQIQPNGPTIQEEIEKAASTILREEITLIGSGRTDAGVHALGQTANFHSQEKIPLEKFQHSLNGILPPDIRILNIEEVPQDFHAQYSAVGKIYFYHLWLDPVQSPFKRLYTHRTRGRISLEKLQEAIPYFVGTHDFTSFANEAHRGTAAHDPVRTLRRLDLVPEEGGVRLEFEADGFLYKMVRNITGHLLEIAEGKRSCHDIESIFEAKDRRKAGKAAPPEGLFLIKVIYAIYPAKRP